MTKDEILAMKPGIELDALVSEKVMGYTYQYDEDWRLMVWTNGDSFKTNSFKPSTDISAAWEVVEKYGWIQVKKYITVGDEVRFTAYIEDNEYQEVTPHSYATGKTAPEAICKAALLTLLEGER